MIKDNCVLPPAREPDVARQDETDAAFKHERIRGTYLPEWARNWIAPSERRNTIIVCGLILISYVLVFPIGEYAENDDWAYAKSLEYLHFEAEFRILEWSPMSLIGHSLWAVPFTKVAGFSFTIMKASVVVLHLIECLVLLRLLRLCRVGDNLALVAVATLIFHPLHFVHSYSFMTDVPAIAWQLVSSLCYIKAMIGNPRQDYVWFVLGSVFAGLAFLVRQHGLLVPIALAAYLLLWDRSRLRPKVLISALAPFAGISGLYTCWYQSVHGPTAQFEIAQDQITKFASNLPIQDLPFIVYTYSIYLGFFLIPLALSMPLSTYRVRWGVRGAIFVASAYVLINLYVFYAVAHDRIFPYMWNVITPFGFFRPDELLPGGFEPVWGRPVGWLIGFAGLLSLLALLNRMLGGKNGSESFDAPLRFFLLLLALQFGYVAATSPILFDRHLLVMMPATIIVFCLLSRNVRKLNRLAFLGCITPMAIYSVAGTHDVHAVSRTVFHAGQALVEEGVDPQFLTAGYAFDGWQLFERSTKSFQFHPPPEWWTINPWSYYDDSIQRTAGDGAEQIRTWWIGNVTHQIDVRYVALAATDSPEISGFEIYRQYSFQNWLPPKVKSIYVLRQSLVEGK
jgi:hypothetical protein